MADPRRSPEWLELVTSIAENLAVGIWVAQAPDGAFVYANRAFSEIMGMGPEPDVQAGAYAEPYGIFGRDGALYPEEKMPFARVLATGAMAMVDDIVIHRRDGLRVYVRAYAQPLFGTGGEMTHVAIAFGDISDEVRAADERNELLRREREARVRLEQSEQRLASVLGQVPIVLFAFDVTGRVTLSEGRGLERMGLRPAELVGTNVLELYRDHPVYLANAHRALGGETFANVEAVGTGVFETTFLPQRGPRGEVVGVIGVSTDVTDRADMQRRLVQVERLAAMGTLAATVAHEINNPLTYVRANLEVLATRMTKLGASLGPLRNTRALLDDVREGVDRVRRIVRDLTAFARDDDRIEPTDLSRVLERATALADNEIRHRARLSRDLQTVPEVLASPSRLCQVFVNLLVNAAHAIPEGATEQHEIQLRTRSDTDRREVVVEVQDSGVGMTDEVRRRVFEPFFTTKAVGDGSGLGLSICRTIVERYGGAIEVESAVGVGSTFRVRLPYTVTAER